MRRRIVILVFDRAQMLDVAGPGDVFALVDSFETKVRYEVLCVSALGGSVVLSNGLSMTTLRAQTGRYAQLVDWISANLSQSMDIATLAARVGESERSFCRRFVAEVGEPPARFIEAVRLGAARRALEGGASAKVAARAAGFASPEQLSRAFRRRLDLSPLDYRRQHRGV